MLDDQPNRLRTLRPARANVRTYSAHEKVDGHDVSFHEHGVRGSNVGDTDVFVRIRSAPIADEIRHLQLHEPETGEPCVEVVQGRRLAVDEALANHEALSPLALHVDGQDFDAVTENAIMDRPPVQVLEGPRRNQERLAAAEGEVIAREPSFGQLVAPPTIGNDVVFTPSRALERGAVYGDFEASTCNRELPDGSPFASSRVFPERERAI
ncbi:MAG: hypothetical protein IV100_32245 [Myxococcales bacterium]|nr:hypothetical protein [Myxococcales bacterium]